MNHSKKKNFSKENKSFENLQNPIIYNKEKEEDFLAQIDEWTDQNKFLACIEVLENIPEEERNYKISYQLARAYQNFAIIGENEEETEYELGSELLKTSISILESVKEEGQNKAEWNMRMAYGYQYLEDQEELAIPYALRWAELDSSDKDALLVVEECKQEIKNRARNQELAKVYKIAEQILKDHNITCSDDYWNRDIQELDKIDEEIYLATKNYSIDEEDIFDTIGNVLEDFENNKENIKEAFHWDEVEGCIATKKIMIDGKKVGYIYRENPDFEGDSGWRFMTGDEDNNYMNDSKNSGIYTLRDIVDKDRDIIPLLYSPIGTSFYRDEKGNFVKDDINILAKQEIDQILYEYNIENWEDYKNTSHEELAEIYENIKIVAEDYGLTDEGVGEILESLLGEFVE